MKITPVRRSTRTTQDDLGDGPTFKRVKGTELEEGQVKRLRDTVLGRNIDAASVFDADNDTAVRLKYTDAATVESLKPTEAGAERNAPSLTGASCTVDDDGSDDDYTVTWTTNGHVTAAFTVVIRYYREGVEVGSTEPTATDASDNFTDPGAGDGVGDVHWATVQLYNGSSAAIGGTLETKHFLSQI